MQPLLAVKHKTPAFYKGTDLTAAEGHYDVLKTTDIKRAKHHDTEMGLQARQAEYLFWYLVVS